MRLPNKDTLYFANYVVVIIQLDPPAHAEVNKVNYHKKPLQKKPTTPEEETSIIIGDQKLLQRDTLKSTFKHLLKTKKNMQDILTNS